MARPRKTRYIHGSITSYYYKPTGIPLRSLGENLLTTDEMEAIRLADKEGLTQEEGAQMMGISRPTFGRILERAHKIIADALINGKALKIESAEWAEFILKNNCANCGKEYETNDIENNPLCPDCYHTSGSHRRRRGRYR